MSTLAAPDDLTTLERTWSRQAGLRGWITDVRHRSIGIRYLVTGSVFFLLAGIAALLMRTQLAVPENTFLDAEVYHQIFTVHGATMMFLFAVPMMEGIAIYVVPMMIGARDMAFPRLNAFGYWVYLIAGSSLWISLFLGAAPNAGWFNYPPLASSRYQPGFHIDVYATTLSLVEIAALIAAVELVVTILKLRTPGMSLSRIPLFVWAMLVTASMIIVAMPPLIVASLLLEMDSKLGTHFYSVGGGGDPLLWQHLFWFFGHPEVYIMLLPGLGIVATLVATFSRRGVLGYRFVVAAFVAIGMASFGLWVHHMFATGQVDAGISLFSVASFTIAIPSGIQVFASLATLWFGRMQMSVPLLHVFGFLFIFIMGGITGINVASLPFDLQVHDSYFVVAHFHYVLLGGVVFPLFGGLYYWFPKITGRSMHHGLGLAAFWATFIGVNVTFFPMHLSGLYGMTRRVYTYQSGLGWDTLNLVSTIGAFVIALGVALFLANALWSRRHGRPAGANPWQAGTLEWATTSPPAPYAFQRQVAVHDRHPLWRQDHGDDPGDSAGTAFPVSADRRETLGTSITAGAPEQRVVQPPSTPVPLIAAMALSVTFLGMLFDPWLVPIGLVLTGAALVAWARPLPGEWDDEWLRAGPPDAPPTHFLAAQRGVWSPTRWGAGLTMAILGIVFASLLTSYLYLRASNAVWPIGEVSPRALLRPLLVSLPLALTVVPLLWARARIRDGHHRDAGLALLAVAVLGVLFFVGQALDHVDLPYNQAANVSASIEFAVVGSHLVLVLALVGVAVVVGVQAWRGLYHAERSDGVVVATAFGLFVVATWVVSFLLIHLGHRYLG